jgi:hypothetical protein
VSNLAEIERIESEALADEGGHVESVPGASVALVDQDASLAGELAEFLNLAANLAGMATRLPVNARFTPEANHAIAQQLIKVCQKHGWDARAVLIGQDSKLGVWIGLGVAIAMPGFGVWGDYKLAKAREVREVEGGEIGGEETGSGQQSRE